MLALTRVLAAPPRLLIADEMSLGLAPKLIDTIFESVRMAKAAGVTIVLVEQFVDGALNSMDAAVLFRQGIVCWRGTASEADAAVREHYLSSTV